MWKVVLCVIMMLLAIAPVMAFEVNVNGVDVTVTYKEPSTNSDGSALQDLSHTNVYHQLGNGEPVKSANVPAVAATGGGAKEVKIAVPVQAGQEASATFWATATDKSSNESAKSATVNLTIDRLPPAPPQ